jgi:aminopeptidase C
MKKLNLKEFQLSQNYLFFYDKLNKSNYYVSSTSLLVIVTALISSTCAAGAGYRECRQED